MRVAFKAAKPQAVEIDSWTSSKKYAVHRRVAEVYLKYHVADPDAQEVYSIFLGAGTAQIEFWRQESRKWNALGSTCPPCA